MRIWQQNQTSPDEQRHIVPCVCAYRGLWKVNGERPMRDESMTDETKKDSASFLLSGIQVGGLVPNDIARLTVAFLSIFSTKSIIEICDQAITDHNLRYGEDPVERKRIAEATKDMSTLCDLAFDTDDEVRRAIKENKNTPPRVLFEMAQALRARSL